MFLCHIKNIFSSEITELHTFCLHMYRFHLNFDVVFQKKASTKISWNICFSNYTKASNNVKDKFRFLTFLHVLYMLAYAYSDYVVY